MLDKQKILDALQEQNEGFGRMLQENQNDSDRSAAYKDWLKTRWEAMQEIYQDVLNDINEGKYDVK